MAISREERRKARLIGRKNSFKRIYSLTGTQPTANELIKQEDKILPFSPDGLFGQGESTLSRQYADHVYGSYLIKMSQKSRLIEYYRMAADPEINYALTEIADEMIQETENKPLFTLKFAEDMKDSKRNILVREFEDIIINKLKLGEYNNVWSWAYKWLIQGILIFKINFDYEKNTGIENLIEIQPWLVSKLQVMTTEIAMENGNMANKFFIVSNSEKAEEGYRHDEKEIILLGSDYETDGEYISILEYAKKDWRRLNLIEDATVIYKLSRSPLRRIFKVYVGTMAPKDIEYHLQNFRQRLREDITYDPDKGEIVGLNPITLLDDYFFPVTDKGDLCSVETLQEKDIGWETMDEIRFFLGKVYRGLKIPIGRMNIPNQAGEYTTATTGSRHGEIMRDEVKFSKFIRRLQKRFVEGFIKELFFKHLFFRNLLEKLKIEEKDVEVKFSYVSPYTELKNAEVEEYRINNFTSLNGSSPLVSSLFLMKDVLHWTDEQVERNLQLLKKEKQILASYGLGEELTEGSGAGGGGGGMGEPPTTGEGEAGGPSGGEDNLIETPNPEEAEEIGTDVGEK